MSEPIATYTTRVSGLWTTRHEISNAEGPLGVLTIERNKKGLVAAGKYVPVKGEVLHFRREPGLMRSQFSVWTDGREWISWSLRPNLVRRRIELSTSSNKPYRLLPMPGFQRGWRLLAPKTGEMARMEPRALRRDSIIRVFRRIDFELVIFAYFLGSQVYAESFWPGGEAADDGEGVPTPSKA